jgi:hypothetical protein
MNNKPGVFEQKTTEALESVLPKQKREAIGRDKKIFDTGSAIVGSLVALGVLNFESFKPPTVTSVLLAAAPLVLVFAIFYVFIHGKLQKDEGIAPGYFVIGAFMLFGAALIGNVLGFDQVVTAGPRGGTPFALVASMLGDFFRAYGIVLFVASAGVGVLAGRAWETLTAD